MPVDIGARVLRAVSGNDVGGLSSSRNPIAGAESFGKREARPQWRSFVKEALGSEVSGWSEFLCEVRGSGQGAVAVTDKKLDMDEATRDWLLGSIMLKDSSFAAANFKGSNGVVKFSPEMQNRVFEVAQELPVYRPHMKAWWRQASSIRSVVWNDKGGSALMSPSTMALVGQWHSEDTCCFRREGGVPPGDHRYQIFYARRVFEPKLKEIAMAAFEHKTPPSGYFTIEAIASRLKVGVEDARACLIQLADVDDGCVAFFGAWGNGVHSVTVQPCFSEEMVGLADKYFHGARASKAE